MEGEEAIPLPVRRAVEEEDGPRADGKVMTTKPADVIGSAMVMEKVQVESRLTVVGAMVAVPLRLPVTAWMVL